MPEVIMRDLIIDRLKETQYNPDVLLKKKRASYLFKNYICNIDENITILDDNLFEVNIGVSDYNEIIYTETFYETNRISRQSNAVNALISCPSSPMAWLIVSVYYHSFFCANLITRLLGRYSCYLSDEDIKGITTYADNKVRKKLGHGNYVGSYISYSNEEIKFKFRGEGERPHYTAWKNLHDKFKSGLDVNGNEADRYNRVQLFKKVIKENNGNWPLPSEIRNKWNYGDTFLYTKRGDDIAKEFYSLIGTSGDLKWSARKNLFPDEKNIANSIAFISSTLNRCLETFKPKILR